jgi:hypothetical protein
MLAEEFREFLKTRYQGKNGKPLTTRAAKDAVSRCRATEKATGIRLPDTASVNKQELILRKLVALKLEAGNLHDLRGAVRKYFLFLEEAAPTRTMRSKQL